MKTHATKRSILSLIIAGVLAGGATATAQTAQVQLATAPAQSNGLDAFLGKSLRGSNQEDFGQVADFLVNPEDGKLHFLLVTSGAGSAGQTYRIVPVSALTSTAPDQFAVAMGQAEWDKVGTLTESRLQGRVTLQPDQLQDLTREFSAAQPGIAAAGAAQTFVRVSQVKGKDVRSGNQKIGRIEDVAIDLNQQMAQPVLAPAGGFATTGQKYVMPFSQLEFTDDAQGAFSTTLSAADFQQQLTPTGRQSADAAAAAVQQALAQNPSLSAAGVQVVPESRIVLRGSVENNEKKAEIEQAARQAAPGLRVDSELTVKGWW